MKAHDLARELLKCDNETVIASIDISTGDSDSDRRIFTSECFGINSKKANAQTIVILFASDPVDNYGKKL